MPIGKRPPLPLILSANDLLDGTVVYRTESGWSEHLATALVAQDEAGALALEQCLLAAERGEEVIAAELIPVALDEEGRIGPSHYRARIRALGPTVRTDLGPQSQGENAHVSL